MGPVAKIGLVAAGAGLMGIGAARATVAGYERAARSDLDKGTYGPGAAIQTSGYWNQQLLTDMGSLLAGGTAVLAGIGGVIALATGHRTSAAALGATALLGGAATVGLRVGRGDGEAAYDALGS